MNSHFSIIHTELYRSVNEVFHSVLNNSESTSTEWDKLNDNITKLEMVIYSNISDTTDFYVNPSLDEQEIKMKI